LGLPGVVRACLRFCDSESNALQTVFSDCKLLLTNSNVLQRIEDEDEFEDEDDLVAARPLYERCRLGSSCG
jgi:hypothetical protein